MGYQPHVVAADLADFSQVPPGAFLPAYLRHFLLFRSPT